MSCIGLGLGMLQIFPELPSQVQCVQGTIPDWAEQMPVLSILNVWDNNLTGGCSAVMAQLESRGT